MKKTIIIVAIAAILLVAGFIAFRYFRDGNTLNPGPQPPPPPAAIRSLVPISEQPVVSYWTRGESVFLVLDDGRISKVVNGAETVVSDQTITDLASAVASPDGNRLLVSFGPVKAPTFSVFDIDADKWSPLPAGTTAAAWSPSGLEIAYLTESSSSSSIGTLNVSSFKKTELLRFAGGDFLLSWVNPKKIYLIEKSSATYPVSSWSLDVAKKTLEPLMDPVPGLVMKWAETGSTALLFTNAFKENRLSLTTPDGKLIALLPFTTLPEKCTLSGEFSGSVYCAVPESIPPGTLLPDDYFTGAVQFSDDIVKWSPGTNIIVQIYKRNSLPIDVEQLTVSAQKIRFINRYDKKVYEVPIP